MKKEKSNMGKWIVIISVLVIFCVLSFIVAGILGLFITPNMDDGNVAVIKINGPITISESEQLISSQSASSTVIVSLIEEADKNPEIKAILLDINSGGGSPVASDEIAQAVKNTNKTTISVIRELGASGAYWIASASDHIIANRMSITGSIGVYSSMFDLSGFLEDNNVTYNLIKAGKYKGIGSPFKELTPEERYQVQKRINLIHDFFIEEIAVNRNLSYKEVEKLATGLWFLGSEAKDMGLVDELGGKNEAIDYIEKKLNITVDLVTYEYRRSLFDSFFMISSDSFYSIGQGIGDSVKEKEEINPQILA